jgi:hypothetical protein
MGDEELQIRDHIYSQPLWMATNGFSEPIKANPHKIVIRIYA